MERDDKPHIDAEGRQWERPTAWAYYAVVRALKTQKAVLRSLVRVRRDRRAYVEHHPEVFRVHSGNEPMPKAALKTLEEFAEREKAIWATIDALYPEGVDWPHASEESALERWKRWHFNRQLRP